MLIAHVAAAAVVGGGGSSATDCLTVFDAPANVPARTPRNVRCKDGDPCDADGTVNGRCEFAVAVCANSTADPRCTATGVSQVLVQHAQDDGDPLFDPELQALAARIGLAFELPERRADRCSAPTSFHVAVHGPFAGGKCKRGSKTIRLTSFATPPGGRAVADGDRLQLVCDPAPQGCAPRAFFTSTFDRIQSQIFDQSCAVSGCHDSQTTRGELLLERGASYDNLVNRVPTNADAGAAGWHRVTVTDGTHGDPATSYLVHKLTGDLGPGFGKRMPFNRPRLDDALVDVVRRWVEAGAPTDGWLPGTD